MSDKKRVVELNPIDLSTVLDALCMLQKTYEGKDAAGRRAAYMEHFGCDSGMPPLSTEELSTEEIGVLYERIRNSPFLPEAPTDALTYEQQ
jgi:hypothetical protein